jgi:hypothetical protein
LAHFVIPVQLRAAGTHATLVTHDPERTSSSAEHTPVSRQRSEHEPALGMQYP